MHALQHEDHAPYSLTHLSNVRLLRELKSLLARERANTALLLAFLAEVDARQLYAPAGCPSIFIYCTQKLHLSEGGAYKRIHAARAARRFPMLFDAVAEGRLHLAAITMIAPFLTKENVSELIEAVTHRSKIEIERFLAGRFPSSAPEPRTVVRALHVQTPESCALEADHGQLVLGPPAEGRPEDSPKQSELAPGRVGAAANDSKETTSLFDSSPILAPERYVVQVTISKDTHDKLRKAQALLGHVITNGNVAQVLDRALDTLIAQLERRKVGARQSSRTTKTAVARRVARYIPAKIRRAVWERDAARCTFVGSDGERCSETRRLEFDHVEPFARGGRATVEGLRLRCRAHNQHEAERVYGRAFMKEKRAAKREVQAIVSALRGLGHPAIEARQAAEFACRTAGTLEDRMRVALESLAREPSRNG